MIIENKKIHDLIQDKDKLVNEGRKMSHTLEDIEVKIKKFEAKERAITEKVDVKELTDRGNELNDECQRKFEKLQKIIKEIEDVRLSHIPEDMKQEHLALMKQREQLEREMNKVALKVQKIKDKVVPLIQKEVKPILQQKRVKEIDFGKYDDIETAKTKDGKIHILTFNRLEEWITKFGK